MTADTFDFLTLPAHVRQLRDFLAADHQRPFDVGVPPLMRIGLLRTRGDRAPQPRDPGAGAEPAAGG